eukprot:g2089.t1
MPSVTIFATNTVTHVQAASGSRPVGEELRLYLDILELQGKHREALDALERFEPTAATSADAPTPSVADADADATAGQGRGTVEDESSLANGTIVNMQELERLELKADLYEKLGAPQDLERAEEVVQGLVRRSPDQWSYYVSLLDLLDKRLSEAASAAEGGRASEWPASLTDALRLMRSLQQEYPRLRGPFLAEMEVLRRAIAWFGADFVPPDHVVNIQGGNEPTGEGTAAAGGGSVSSGEGSGESMLWGLLCRCISRYMALFSAKLCCFTDLRPHLALFVTAGRDGRNSSSVSSGVLEGLAWLKDFFRREAAESKVDVTAGGDEGKAEGEQEPLDQEQRELGVKKHLLGDVTASSPNGGNKDDSAGDDESSDGAVATPLADAVEPPVAGAESGDNEETHYRDVVRELTTQYRATLHLNLGSEGGQREVQHGDELVILAVRTLLKLCSLYDRTASAASGAGAGGTGHAKGYLGRVDTLSYLMLGASHRHGLFGEVQGQCKVVAAVHRSCKHDTAEHVARAFDRGNYSKGAEVDRFQREKLDLSLQLAMAKALRVTMDVILDHQTFASAARCLQEEEMPGRGGGATFPGDDWLAGLRENMDYSVQRDRCLVVDEAEETSIAEARQARLRASLKRRLLANETLLLGLKGGPPAKVDEKAKELEAAVSGSWSLLPWQMLADASRALALTHSGVVKEGAGDDGGGGAAVSDSVLQEAADAMGRAGASAKSCRELLAACPRHVIALDGSKDGAEGGGKVYQAEAPLRSEWFGVVSKTLTDGLVYTAIVLQALGAELPSDTKKKKGGKGKGKGKGKKAAEPAGAAAAGASRARLVAQEALSAFGWEVSELLRAMSTALKSEISAKGDPARPGETLSRLLKGELGADYKSTIGVLWEADGVRWCGEKVVPEVVVGVTGSQAICCQRLLSVVTENLAMLQRWEKKGG